MSDNDHAVWLAAQERGLQFRSAWALLDADLVGLRTAFFEELNAEAEHLSARGAARERLVLPV